jgi:ABC-2 type transport system permease protein
MADHGKTGSARKVLAVALREFRYTVLTKGFIFGALVMPVIMFGAIAAIGWFVGTQLPPVTGSVAIVDPSGSVAPLAGEELSPDRLAKLQEEAAEKLGKALPVAGGRAAGTAATRVEITVEAVTDDSKASEDALRARVQDGTLLGIAVVPAEVLSADPKDAGFRMIVPSKSPPRLTGTLERAVARAIVQARVKRAGNDYGSLRALLSVPETNVRRLAPNGSESDESMAAKTLLPMGFMMLLWIATFTSGQYLLTTTIEEKSSKVMEVILSAVSPMELLGGKILGYAMVSALMLGMYGGLGIAGLGAAGMGDLVSPGMLVLMAVYFVMAYAFVSTMMASVGSAVNDLREAQSLVTPAMLILTIPLMLWLPISEQPNGTLATVASFVPPAIPFVMILRVTASSEPIAAWQVAASIAWGFACVGVFLWAGAKIFRVGVLMQGKPPTPKELLKWVRTA